MNFPASMTKARLHVLVIGFIAALGAAPTAYAQAEIDKKYIREMVDAADACEKFSQECMQASSAMGHLYDRGFGDVFQILHYKYVLKNCIEAKLYQCHADTTRERLGWDNAGYMNGAFTRYEEEIIDKTPLPAVRMKVWKQRCRKRKEQYACGYTADDSVNVIQSELAYIERTFDPENDPTYLAVVDRLNHRDFELPSDAIRYVEGGNKYSKYEILYRCRPDDMDIYFVLRGSVRTASEGMKDARRHITNVEKFYCRELESKDHSVTITYATEEGELLGQPRSQGRRGISPTVGKFVRMEFSYPGEMSALVQSDLNSFRSIADLDTQRRILHKFPRLYTQSCRSQVASTIVIDTVRETSRGGQTIDRSEGSYEVDGAFAPSQRFLLNNWTAVLQAMSIDSDLSKFFRNFDCQSTEMEAFRATLLQLQDEDYR